MCLDAQKTRARFKGVSFTGKIMSKLKELDIVLGEALEHADYSARLIRECDELDTKEHLRKIGHAIIQLWDTRNQIYKLNPELKPELVSEYENDEGRYEKLTQLHTDAYELEQSNDMSSAKKAYEKLLKESNYGHFKRLAEAGLYRAIKES